MLGLIEGSGLLSIFKGILEVSFFFSIVLYQSIIGIQ